MKILLIALIGIVASFCQVTQKQISGSQLNSVGDLRDAIDAIKQQPSMVAADVDRLFDAVGDNINPEEGQLLFDFFKGKTGYQPSPAMVALALERAMVHGLAPQEQQLLKERKALSGGTIPEAVIEVLSWARLAGATPYDVSESDPNNPQEGLWSPYPQSLAAQDVLAFDRTQISKESLDADMQDQSESNRIVGSSGGSVTYRKDKCLGNRGDIGANYDEDDHTDYYARGTSCQKWANNCAVMFDGSVHCLLAPRRTPQYDNLILTNPSLGRGKHMLFNGHIDARKGVISYVGISGRIAKKAARKDNAFVDPIPLLRAWGVEVGSALATVSEHYETADSFAVDRESFTLRSKD